nr:hypothetical protein BaRGS_006217 [Batillaria attramentaria]
MVKWGHILISDAILSLLLSVNSQALTNVALHKPTQQSTYHPGFGKPENVVDGNSDTHLDYCTHTADRDQNPTRWWMVDLRAFYTVHTVLITNRGDCCGFRLSDFDVEVSTQNLARVAMTSQNTQLCYHHAGSVADGATVQVDCSQPIRGRYVRVVLHTSVEPLNICEVQVLATSVAPAFILTHNFVRTKAHKAPGDVIQQCCCSVLLLL